MNRVLIVAYHFPPCAVSSGIQRTLSFTKHLPKHDWLPVVLTANESAYERTNPSQIASIPPEVQVSRAFALDAARHLSIKGRYLTSLATPDRWRTWWLSAVPLGLQLIKRHSIKAIWSTYPITTAHSIGATLARISGLPWIADFRDPMVEHVEKSDEWFPKDAALRNARLRIESKAAKYARKLVFCTNSAKEIVAHRYPNLRSDQLAVISNGYDEQAFSAAETLIGDDTRSGKLVLLHSGTIYLGSDRDPTALFGALKELAAKGLIGEKNFELRLRDPSSAATLQKMVNDFGIAALVSILPSIPYSQALAEMMQVDGLLTLQGHTSNPAVPAKLYEYFRARKPIIGLVDAKGETAAALRTAKIDLVADIQDQANISKIVARWAQTARTTAVGSADREIATRYSRENLTESLATILNDIAL